MSNRTLIKNTVTLRSFLIGIVCVIGLCALTPYNNHYVNGSAYPSSNHLPFGPLFLIVLLTLLFNVVLRQIHPKAMLSHTELIVIWCMMVVAVAIPSKAYAEYLLPDLVAPYYLATEENEWEDVFHQYIPSWLAPKDKYAVTYFYKGTPPRGIPWQAWSKPILAWSVYAFGLYAMMYCMSVILRKQWIEHEKLTFPLVQLPAEIVKDPDHNSTFNSFFKNPIMWVGFGISGFIHVLNGFNVYFPYVPRVPTQFSLDSFLTDKPWNMLQPFPITFQPSVIGVTFLLTLRVSFSVWFFYMLYKFQCFMAGIFGLRLTSSPGEFGFTYTFASHQEMGAFIVVVIFLLWRAKQHLRNVIKGVFMSVDDSDEPLPYRWAFIGLIVSILVQVLLSQLMGMTFLIAFLIALAFGIMSFIFAWQISSAGILRVDSTFEPMMALITIIGGRRIGAGNFTIDSIQTRGFRTDISQLPMPSMMNIFKMADGSKVNKRLFTLCLFLAILVAFAVSSYFFISLSYKYGGENLTSWNYQNGPRGAYESLVYRITNPSEQSLQDIGFIFAGAAFTTFIMVMYHKFLWWPFHPIGCTTGSSWGVREMLFSIFLGWFFKSAILRYGGLRGYRSMYPLFLGLIFGEYMIGGIWLVIGLFTGKGYQVLPN